MAAGGSLLAADSLQREMNVISARPEDLEMPLSGFADYLTPSEHFFVRTHVYVPSVNPDEWRLRVEGGAAGPLVFTLDDLKRMPAAELIAVAECAGNGRKLFDPPVPGLQWTNGAVGNARWRGVRLAEVLRKAGVKETAREILFDGADVPLGTMQDFRRAIPVKKALDPNTLLAFEMNGRTLPMKHGFPLRVIAPGWASDSWVKWLTTVTVLDREFDGFWMKSAYRKPDHPVAPGSVIAAEQMQPVTSLRVKSVIASPLDGATFPPAQPVTIQGVAWSGDSGPVAAVEVSVDGGRTWSAATLLAGQRTRFGWRQWQFRWTPAREAYYNVIARARDAAGNVQPFAQEWNPAGYGWNVTPRIGVNVARSGGAPQEATLEAAPAPDERLRRTCLLCHGDDVIRQQRLTRAQWDRELTKMSGWGAPLRPEDRGSFLDYLVKYFGTGK